MKKNKIIQWWFTPKFPKQQIANVLSYKPKGFSKIFKNLYRTWLIHPVKRRIAKYYLIFLKKFFGLKVVGITGSAGKTTTKEMAASILKQKDETVASFANIDPIYNIPTTILKCKPSTRFLILEMGVEYPGEMDFYLWLVKPDIGVITNIFPTHTLFFGDEKGVAKEKGKLVKSLKKNNVAILNKENKFTKAIGDKDLSKIIWFGEDGDVDFKNQKISLDLSTQYTLSIDGENTLVKIPILGSQFVKDSLAAASIAFALGFSIDEIKSGLENYKKPEHRMNVVKLKNGALLIDDSYNSNPSAAEEALKTFKSIVHKRKSILVFGDMLELGKREKYFHKKVGVLISKYKFDYLIGVGKLSKIIVDENKRIMKNRAYSASSQEEVLSILKPLLSKNSIVLFKGSRSIGLDKVVAQLV